eukprot:522500-Pleurochrysis_carterae.AAC.1
MSQPGGSAVRAKLVVVGRLFGGEEDRPALGVEVVDAEPLRELTEVEDVLPSHHDLLGVREPHRQSRFVRLGGRGRWARFGSPSGRCWRESGASRVGLGARRDLGRGASAREGGGARQKEGSRGG